MWDNPAVTLAFSETRKFARTREDYFAGDDAYSALQQALLADPDTGSAIRGCGGLRKMRWPDPRRGKGTRGGLRIVYLHVPDASVILFLKVCQIPPAKARGLVPHSQALAVERNKRLPDFPKSALAPHRVQAMHPDRYLAALFEDMSELFLLAVREHRAALTRPPKTAEAYLETLKANHLTQPATLLAEHLEEI